MVGLFFACPGCGEPLDDEKGCLNFACYSTGAAAAAPPDAGKGQTLGKGYPDADAPLMDLWLAVDHIGHKLLHEHIIPNDFIGVPLHTELLLFISEIIEIFEDERRGIVESAKLPGFTAVEEEAADIVLRVLSASASRGWRIGAAMKAKHAYNLTRPYRHGKKL